MDAMATNVRGDAGHSSSEAGSGVVTTLYEGTASPSPAREFMADVFGGYANKEQILDVVNTAPSEFLQDFSIAIAGNKTTCALSRVQNKAS
jgi:hypothetical protein